MKRLDNLPLDILFELISLLKVHDALSLVSVSHTFHGLRFHHSFWHILLQTLRLSSVPLACPPYSDLTQELEEITLRTIQRQRNLLSSPNPRPIRVRKYLECSHFSDSICPISGTNMYLTCGINDGMAKCWNLPEGKILSQVYIGRNILAKSTLPLHKGKFLVCLLVADTLQEFVATSVIVLCLTYDSSYSDVELSILHHSPLDAAYPAMYPSCAINSEGIISVVKMATSVHILTVNAFNGARTVVETDLTEIEIDSIDLAFNGLDLILAASNSRTTWLYQCPKDYLPYSIHDDLSPTTQYHHLTLSSSVPAPLSTEMNLFSYERCGFYASSQTTSARHHPFAATAYYATGDGNDQYTECCFWDLDSAVKGRISTTLAHKCRLPGLQFIEVTCTGSESGSWGVFVCDVDMDPDVNGIAIGHDFEIDVGTGVSSPLAERSQVANMISDSTNKVEAEIYLVHYDVSTRTSSLHRPQVPEFIPGVRQAQSASPYSWINDIKNLEFDERLGVLYIMMNSLEGGILCAMEFL